MCYFADFFFLHGCCGVNLGPHAASTFSTVPPPHPSSCVVLRAPWTIGNHTHELSMPVHGQRGRKRVYIGRGADSVKGEGDQHRNRDKQVAVCIPFCKGTSSLSPSFSLFILYPCVCMLCGLFLYPLSMAECQEIMCKCHEMDGWMFTLSSKGELLGCRLGVFIILCNIWPLTPKWLDPHLRFEDVVTQKPLFLSP